MTDAEKLAYLIEKLRIINQAIDNELPSEALLELRKTQQAIDGWKDDQRDA